jgi:hypothetical protein
MSSWKATGSIDAFSVSAARLSVALLVLASN